MTPDEICALRADLGWSRQRFGQAFGASETTVWRWERGDAFPNAMAMAAMQKIREDMGTIGKGEVSDFAHKLSVLLLTGGALAFLIFLFGDRDK